MAEIASFDDPGDLPLMVMEKAEITFTDSAKLKATINAGMVETYEYRGKKNKLEDQKMVMSKSVLANFYDKNEMKTGTMIADRAERLESENKTHLYGHVKVVNTDGDQLTSDYLLWDEKLNTISTDKKVKVKTATEIIEAEGFSSDIHFKEYTFEKVTGTISLN